MQAGRRWRGGGGDSKSLPAQGEAFIQSTAALSTSGVNWWFFHGFEGHGSISQQWNLAIISALPPTTDGAKGSVFLTFFQS